MQFLANVSEFCAQESIIILFQFAATPYLKQVLRDGNGPGKDFAEYFSYQHGLGVEVDKPRAAKALIRTAEAGESTAMLMAAELYANGDPESEVRPNTTEAIKYYTYAVMSGRTPARFNLAVLTLRLIEEQPDAMQQHEVCAVVYDHFRSVAVDMHPIFRLIFAHGMRAYELGDKLGALMRFSFLAELGSPVSAINAAQILEQDRPTEKQVLELPPKFFEMALPRPKVMHHIEDDHEYENDDDDDVRIVNQNCKTKVSFPKADGFDDDTIEVKDGYFCCPNKNCNSPNWFFNDGIGPEACLKKCEEDPRCKFMTIYQSSGWCQLSEDCSATKIAGDASSSTYQVLREKKCKPKKMAKKMKPKPKPPPAPQQQPQQPQLGPSCMPGKFL